VTAPAIWLLSHATDLTVRLFGGDPDRRPAGGHRGGDPRSDRDPASYTDEQRQIIDGALEVADRTLRQIVVPRSRVSWRSPADLPVDDALHGSPRPVTAGRPSTPTISTTPIGPSPCSG
jgi:putative hemolysin